MTPRPISLCMIVKNEARLISACLERARAVAAQLVVVDTGSVDGTPALARAAGAEVYHHPWEGSFSKARNISLSYAREPWVLILDGDELLDEGSAAALSALDLGAGAPEAYEFTIVNFSTDDADERAANLQWQVRLFRRALGAYGGVVHNQLAHAAEGRPLAAARAAARVLHYGYVPSVWAAQRKDARLALLERAAREERSAFSSYNLANHLKILGRHREALECFVAALPSGPLTEEWMPIACCSAAFCASRVGLHEVAVALADVALAGEPLLLDAHLRRAEALGALGRHAEAAGQLAAALASPRREAIKLRALCVDAPYALGRALFLTGAAEEALLVFLSLAAGTADVTVYTHLCLCAAALGEGGLLRWARARGAALAPNDPDWAVVDAQAARAQGRGAEGARAG
ncbi:MAG: glycosyltransferase family 2 protein, partial [Deltaproteobacteria bacterium]|nr:glycosyltransferase family 2 protein [Deltaproteobacteria bacterium]